MARTALTSEVTRITAGACSKNRHPPALQQQKFYWQVGERNTNCNISLHTEKCKITALLSRLTLFSHPIKFTLIFFFHGQKISH